MSMPKKKAVRRRKADVMLADADDNAHDNADTMLAMADNMDVDMVEASVVVKKESKAKRPRTMTSCFESMLTNMQGLSTLVQGLTYKVDDMQSLSSQLNIKVEKLSERVDQAQAEQMQAQQMQAEQMQAQQMQAQAEPKQAQAQQMQQMQQMQPKQMQALQHMQKVQPRQEMLIQVDALQEQQTIQTLLAGVNVIEEHMNRMYEAPNYVTGVSKVILDVLSEAGSLQVHGRELLVKEHDSSWIILTHPGLLQILLYVGKALFACFVEWSKNLKAPFSEFDDNGDKHAALHKSILVDGYFLLKTKLVPGKVDVQGKLVKQVHNELRKLLNE